MKSLLNKLSKTFLILFIIALVGVVIVEGTIIGADLTHHEDIVKSIMNYFHF